MNYNTAIVNLAVSARHLLALELADHHSGPVLELVTSNALVWVDVVILRSNAPSVLGCIHDLKTVKATLSQVALGEAVSQVHELSILELASPFHVHSLGIVAGDLLDVLATACLEPGVLCSTT